MSKRSVWVTYGRTEDNDDLQPLVWWGAKPTDEEVYAVYGRLGVEVNDTLFHTVKASIQ